MMRLRCARFSYFVYLMHMHTQFMVTTQCYDGVVILVYVAGKHMCSHVLLARGLRTRGHIIFGF